MGKIQDKFEDVRKLKSQGKSIDEIALILEIKKGSIEWIFSAINKGFNSLLDYRNHCIYNMINLETGDKFIDLKEYSNYFARKKGFNNYSNYVQFRKLEARLNGKSLSKQEEFERSIKTFPLEKMLNLPSKNGYNEKNTENKDHLNQLLNRIPNIWKTILEMRYIDEKTQEEIGREINITYQGVQQIEKKALNYLASGSRNKIKFHKKTEDGELLLIHILSKSYEDWKDITGNFKKYGRINYLFNEIYHEGNQIRSSSSVYEMINNKRYKKRLEKIKKNIFR